MLTTLIASISSPKNSMRWTSSSSTPTNSSVSPRTRNVPRTRLRSLRRYCMSISLRRSSVAVDLVADLDVGRQLHVVGGRAQAVDARDRGDDQRIGPRQQRLRRRMAQPLDLVVDRGVFLDVGVGVRDVRFGLIVVEVRDEILDRVVGKEIAELGAQLRGERLVVAEHQRRLLHELDDPRHRHRLAAAGHAQQRLRAVAAQDACGQRVGRRGLVARQAHTG